MTLSICIDAVRASSGDLDGWDLKANGSEHDTLTVPLDQEDTT
jgi:hypothetical protein